MQSLWLVLESVGGTLAVVYAGAFLRSRRRKLVPLPVEPVFCDALAPDENIRCLENPFHYGWHRNGGMTWFGSVWSMGEPVGVKHSVPLAAGRRPEATRPTMRELPKTRAEKCREMRADVIRSAQSAPRRSPPQTQLPR